MTNAALREILEGLERKWVGRLEEHFAGDEAWPEIAGSDMQFFSIDFPPPQEKPNKPQTADNDSSLASPAAVIACVEMNYKAFPPRLGRNAVPHISTETHALTWVVDDPKNARRTRRALAVALDSYLDNASTWTENGYASAETLLSREMKGRPIILIKTFLSPFLLAKPWALYAGSSQTAALRAWNPNQHICDLSETLGKQIDLWVIEGAPLWRHFFADSEEIANWILTPMLTYESQRNKSIQTFWKTTRREDRQREVAFPICPS
jgi:hypothetical protein